MADIACVMQDFQEHVITYDGINGIITYTRTCFTVLTAGVKDSILTFAVDNSILLLKAEEDTCIWNSFMQSLH